MHLIYCDESGNTGTNLSDPAQPVFLLGARVANEFLRSLPGSPNGILISDENKEVARDVEKSIRALRFEPGLLNLSQIIEKGFFIESHKSRLLQLADLCAYTARRKEEDKLGFKIRDLDRSGLPLIEPLIHRGKESLQDILDWWASEQKKGAAGE